MKHRQTNSKVSSPTKIEHALLEEIEMGRILPGERIDESGLSQRFGVSRTPVREAINRLIGQGVLVRDSSRGASIKIYSREQVAELFEAMYEIELVCLGLATKRSSLLTQTAIEEAHKECKACAEASDFDGYRRANLRFHHAIYKAAGNTFVGDTARDLKRRAAPFSVQAFSSQEGLLNSVAGHQLMLDVLKSNDTANAINALREQMQSGFAMALAQIDG